MKTDLHLKIHKLDPKYMYLKHFFSRFEPLSSTKRWQPSCKHVTIASVRLNNIEESDRISSIVSVFSVCVQSFKFVTVLKFKRWAYLLGMYSILYYRYNAPKLFYNFLYTHTHSHSTWYLFEIQFDHTEHTFFLNIITRTNTYTVYIIYYLYKTVPILKHLVNGGLYERRVIRQHRATDWNVELTLNNKNLRRNNSLGLFERGWKDIYWGGRVIHFHEIFLLSHLFFRPRVAQLKRRWFL